MRGSRIISQWGAPRDDQQNHPSGSPHRKLALFSVTLVYEFKEFELTNVMINY